MATTTFHLKGNYAPVHDELTAYGLPVTGADTARAERLVSAQWAEPARGVRALVHR